MRLYNTLARRIEEFKPIHPPKVSLYTCGPTVYFYAHLGNFRTFLFEDFLRRILVYNGYRVKQVMNITDVGHLTGDNLGDADLGEDRMEQAVRSEGKTVEEIAEYYTRVFLRDLKLLNILPAQVLPKATQHIPEQIELIKKLELRGLVYQTTSAVYFDTAAYEKKGYDYAALAHQDLEDKSVGAREEVVVDKEKKSSADFGLWFFTVGRFANHIMRWDSPWGVGFPGWHLECSAMSRKFLGQPFDIHTGGEDHVALHHTNELAQSQGAYDQPLAKFWLHGRFMLVAGERMGKSQGNVYLVKDLIERGFDPLSFRYLCLQTHYRQPMNFTWEGLQAAQNALKRLREFARSIPENSENSVNQRVRESEFSGRFLAAINDDLNLPQALAVVWDLVRSVRSNQSWQKAAYDLLLDFDQVLSLNLGEVTKEQIEIPNEIQKLVWEREKLRKQNQFDKADQLRDIIKSKGYRVEDRPEGPIVKKSE